MPTTTPDRFVAVQAAQTAESALSDAFHAHAAACADVVAVRLFNLQENLRAEGTPSEAVVTFTLLQELAHATGDRTAERAELVGVQKLARELHYSPAWVLRDGTRLQIHLFAK